MFVDQNRWLVPLDKQLDSEARHRYDSLTDVEPAQWNTVKAKPVQKEKAKSKKKATVKAKLRRPADW